MNVWVVFYNADMTEGRGPMLFHSVWDNYQACVEFVDAQPGVMGTTGKWSKDEYGPWKIKEAVVNHSVANYESHEKAQQRKRALAKLTFEERKLLGL